MTLKELKQRHKEWKEKQPKKEHKPYLTKGEYYKKHNLKNHTKI